jgi:peptidoglycan hydrolase-like protein with peptidoglycan-binding domain
MALQTSHLRQVWSPPCQGPLARVTLHGGGVVAVRASVVEAAQALSATFKAHGYSATGPDCGAYNCRQITGGRGYSLHAYAIAVDVNWQRNPYGSRLVTDMPIAMTNAVKSIRTRNGQQVWGWGGDYRRNKDAMHFEVVCSPRDLASGVDWRTVAGKGHAAVPVKRVMEAGDTGPAVGFTQAMLNIITTTFPLGDRQPLRIASPAGFGPRTQARVMEFQRFYNEVIAWTRSPKPQIAVDGVVGPATQAAIGEMVKAALKKQGKG